MLKENEESSQYQASDSVKLTMVKVDIDYEINYIMLLSKVHLLIGMKSSASIIDINTGKEQ
jgi:hypothetical protein